MIDHYLTEIRKIASHGARGEPEKVRLYVEQLASRLATDGHPGMADSLREAVKPSSRPSVTPAIAGIVGRSLPVDGESRLPVGDEALFQPSEVEVFLPPAAAGVVHKFVAFTQASDRLAAAGVPVRPSMLLCGPPGCGKTQTARWVASQLGRPLLTARTDSIVSSYLGSTAKNIRSLFEHASRAHSVLFLDELDALGKMRDDARELGELKRVVISLLQNIDAAGDSLVLLAATNHPHLLDPAVWRRFRFTVQLGLPSSEARGLILRKGFKQFASEHTVEVLAAITDGYSGAALEQAAEDCVRAAVLDGRDRVDPEEALRAILAASPEAGPVPEAHDALIRTVAERAGGRLQQKQIAEFFRVSASTVSKAKKK